jgi:hypothetical protein
VNRQLNIQSLFLPFGLVIVFGCFGAYYLMHTHQELLSDYLSVTPCFYRKQSFVSNVFTQLTKYRGDLFIYLSFPCILIFAQYFIFDFSCWLQYKRWVTQIQQNLFFYLGLIVLCILLFLYGIHLNPPSTDEVFSAYNFANKPLVHIVSYYPIPNNHILFDVLNHFAGKLNGNYVLSGRILSGFFYTLFILGSFKFLGRQGLNPFIAFLCSALLAQQFIVWGFGTQARGYSLCFLFQWWSFVCFYLYFFSNNSNKAYYLMGLVCSTVLGFWTIPIFLYFFVFQLLIAFLIVLKRRKIDLKFWWSILVSISGVFLVYLPVICFSGSNLLFANKYISGTNANFKSLSIDFGKYFSETILPALFANEHLIFCWLLFLLPALIYFLFRKRLQIPKEWLLLYVMVWCSVWLLVLGMKQLTFLRVVGFQMHLSYLLFLWLVGTFIQSFRVQKRISFFVGIVTFCISTFLIQQYNRSIVFSQLYGQDPKRFYNELSSKTSVIPSHKNIWLSDESFYWKYLLSSKHHIEMYDCAYNQQEVIIVSEDDKFSSSINLEHYHLLEQVLGFSIYERND